MPANFDSIDLNSNVVSGEREDGVNGFSNVSVVKSMVGLSSDAETLMDSVTNSQGQNQEPVVDEVKDFKGGNDLKEVAVGGLGWEGKMDSVYKSVDFEGENGSGSGVGDASVREAAEITETHSSKVVGEENSSCEIEGEVKAGGCGGVSSSSVGEDAIQVENANVEVKVDSANDLLPRKKPGNVSPKVSSEGVENQGMEINDEQAKNSEGQNEDAAAFDERVLQEIENLESNDLNLVADSEPYVGADGNAKMASKEAGLGVGDLVWGKVRSHPWWPGQLFGCADASKKAKKYFKKDSYLIAYLGDQTFAWNEVSKIKPFRCNFSLLEKQSNLEDFHDAVHCALDEVSRRVEFGLACPCMPGYSKIKTQIIVNPGIREESCRRDGGDSFSSAASFEPAKLNDYVKELGQLPLSGIDTLEFVTARSQLLAFNRWKGYCHLPEFQFLGELLESDAEIPLSPEVKHGSEKVDNAATTVGKEKPKSEDHSLHRRKCKRIYGDDEHPSEKEKCLADLIAERRASAAKGKGGLDGEATGEMTKSSSGRKRKAVDSISDDSVMKQSKSPSSPGIDNGSSQPKKTYRVGDSILRVASQLNTSTPILKSVNGTYQKTAVKAKSQEKSAPGKCKEIYEGMQLPEIYQSSVENKNEAGEIPVKTPTKKGTPTFGKQSAVQVGPDLECGTTNCWWNSRFGSSKPKDHLEGKANDTCPTALIINFADLEAALSETNLNRLLGHFGALKETETRVLKKSKRAKVVFRRCVYAETAFSSAGKYSIFGPSLVSYRLKYIAPTNGKSSPNAAKRSKKEASSAEGIAIDASNSDE